MKFTMVLLFAAISFSASANTGRCEIFYSSLEDYKLRWMDGDKDELGDATLEECVAHAERMLGERRQWKTLVRKDIRKITQARYKFMGDSVSASGKLALPGLEF